MEWCIGKKKDSANLAVHIDHVKECVHEFILKHTLDEIKFETLINTENFDTTIRMTLGQPTMEKTILEFKFKINSVDINY